ncbi:hypothetical protein MmTuc01_3368 [Methanosarcina mazei Tuc01]|uniref:Uncharacterized protein n=1 Tax=Methanosarcina mazei Tuc01 TaxID=1236903 RepID=M1PDI9_METMZ|nr:hypothetical protein MmTuc01_3368 [Methanosarcina mazei Tuc01]
MALTKKDIPEQGLLLKTAPKYQNLPEPQAFHIEDYYPSDL